MAFYYGCGLSYAGSTDAGYGQTFQAPIKAPYLLNDPFGPGSLTGRRIDPVTKDYVMSTTGNLYGMTTAQQLVELAFVTVLNSSSVLGMGNDLASIRVITDSFTKDVTQLIQSALSDLVNRKIISITSITVDRFGTTGGYFITRWVDLGTQIEQVKVI
jgi:hypothetical protein